MIAGTAYGIVLNDRDELTARTDTFGAAPYLAPPKAPVLYIKPRPCLTHGGAPVVVPTEEGELEIAATVALLFGVEGPVAACLALEVSIPHRDYYRPAIRERCRDTFLPLAEFAALPDRWDGLEIVTTIDGVEAHLWSLARLARPVDRLTADVQEFMTLQPGDLLMVGLAGDAPRASVGQKVGVTAGSLPPLTTYLVAEDAA